MGGCKSSQAGLTEPALVAPVRSRTRWERAARAGESPVGETRSSAGDWYLSTAGHVKSRGKLGGPPSKAKYSWRPIVNEYREGKVKSTPGGG